MFIQLRHWLARLLATASSGVQAQPLDGPLHNVAGYAPGGSSDRVAPFFASMSMRKGRVKQLAEATTLSAVA